MFSASTQAVQTSISNLTSTVKQILQASEDVARRVANIETRFAIPIGHPESTLRAPLTNDDASTIIPLAQDTWDHDSFAQSIREKGDPEQPLPEVIDTASSGTSKGQISFGGQHSSSTIGRQVARFDPTLESELYESRVYSRNTHRHSISSLCSTENSATGLSFLSGISLAQVSNLSVISLPILCHELWNSQQYQTPQNSGRGASLIAESPSSHKSSGDYDYSVKGSRESLSNSIFGLIKKENPLEELPKSPPKAKPTAHLVHELKSGKKTLESEVKIVLLGK